MANNKNKLSLVQEGVKIFFLVDATYMHVLPVWVCVPALELNTTDDSMYNYTREEEEEKEEN